jgi:hypothetical protein
MMATSWEYKLEELTFDATTVVERLNEESEEGWNLVTTVEVCGDNVKRSLLRLIFRREVTNATWDQ